MTPKERLVFTRLRNYTENMLIPGHDEYKGHNRQSCHFCRTMEAADAILGAA